MLLLLLKVSVSPVKKPLMLTVAKAKLVLSVSLAVALKSSDTGVLNDEAGLSVLSEKVAFATGAIDSVGSSSNCRLAICGVAVAGKPGLMVAMTLVTVVPVASSWAATI